MTNITTLNKLRTLLLNNNHCLYLLTPSINTYTLSLIYKHSTLFNIKLLTIKTNYLNKLDTNSIHKGKYTLALFNNLKYFIHFYNKYLINNNYCYHMGYQGNNLITTYTFNLLKLNTNNINLFNKLILLITRLLNLFSILLNQITSNYKTMNEFKVNQIFNELCNLSLLELSSLISRLKDKFTLTGTLNINKDTTKTITKTPLVNLTLTKLGPSRINIIKLIKELTNLSLKESKSLIDKLPCIILSNIETNKATELSDKFSKLECIVELK